MRKSLLLSIIALTFTASFSSSFGQAMHHAQFQMHQQMQMLHMMSMNRLNSELSNPISLYKIVMKDNSLQEVNAKIKFDEKNVSYLEVVNKIYGRNDPKRIQRIYPADTRSITKIYSSTISSVPGMPSDSCWLFKSVKGNINGYSFLPLPYPQTHVSMAYFKFLQKGDGRLQLVHKDSLQVMMQDNEKATKYLKKGDPFGAIKEYNFVTSVNK